MNTVLLQCGDLVSYSEHYIEEYYDITIKPLLGIILFSSYDGFTVFWNDNIISTESRVHLRKR